LGFQISNGVVLLMMLLACSAAFAGVPPPSTDDQLRDSLNSKAADDYDRELLGDSAKPDGKSRVDEQMQKKLQKELGAAAEKEDQPKAPLLKVAEAMRAVQPRLGRRDSGDGTQIMQRQIVSDLEKMIEQAKKSGQRGKSPGGPKPTGNAQQKAGEPSGGSQKPVQVSDPKLRRPDEEVRKEKAQETVAAMKRLNAELHKGERQHVLQLPSEHFLPEYELEIEDYFRRLSEDHPELEKP
jgi:hypothetical protein